MDIDTTAVETAVYAAVRHDDDLTALAQICVARNELVFMERNWVARARRAGLSWQQIGDALGTSRQAVHERYRSVGAAHQ